MVFGLGLAFGAWSILCLFNATNSAESIYPVGRFFLQLILLFIIMDTVMKEEQQVLRLCKAIMLFSMVQSLAGIGQYYEFGFENIPGNFIPYGLMANRNLFGSAQMLVIPFLVYTLYKGSKGWRIISILSLAGIVISLLLSQTRSAWLGSFFILVCSLLLVIFFAKASLKNWLLGTGAAVVAMAGLVLLIIQTDPNGTLSASIKERTLNISPVEVADSSTSSAAGNVNERFKIWKSTLSLIKDHPLTGVGPGNWKIAIPVYGRADMAWAGGFFIPDEPHNVYLFVTAETGLPGAILYFAGWILIALMGITVIRRSASADKKILVILMLGGLGAFAIDSMFSFPTQRIEHSLYMMLMGGIVLGSYATEAAATAASKPWVIKRPAWIAAALILVFNLFIGRQKYNLEVHANMAHGYNKAKKYPEVLEEVKQGTHSLVTLDPNGTPLEMYSGIAYKNLKNYPEALKAMNRARRLAPHNAKVYNNLGAIYTDLKDYTHAVETYQKALKLTPKFEAVYKNLAVNYFQLGNYAACVETFNHFDPKGDEYFTALLQEAKTKLEAGK
jgi:O-antigen ligase